MKQDKNQDKNQDQKPDKKNTGRGPMAFLKSNRFKHGGMSLIMTIVFIALIVLVNVLTGLLSDRFPSINIDMTAQGLNTLSEDALDAAKNVEKETQIIILATEDDARQSTNYSQVVNLAERMNEVNRLITVEFKDLDANPTMQSNYENETLTQGDVIVQAGERYRYLSMSGDLFTYEMNSSGTAYDSYSQVDGALANALVAVNAETSAKVAFVTGHSEAMSSDYRGDFESLLSDQLYEVEEFNILTEEIPDDANIVMVPAPTTDFTTQEIEKLRNYLADSSGDYDRTVIYVANISASTPILSEFLEEWGISVGEGYVTETDTSKFVSMYPYYIMVDNTSTLLEDNTYTYLLSPVSSPLEILFDYNDDISVSPLWTSSNTAYVTIDETSDPEVTGTQAYVTATLSRKQMSSDGSKYNNVVVFGSYTAFSDNLANNNTYGNKSFYTDLLSELTGIEPTATYIESVSTSTTDISADSGLLQFLGIGIFTVTVPVLIALIGFVVYLRRRRK